MSYLVIDELDSCNSEFDTLDEAKSYANELIKECGDDGWPEEILQGAIKIAIVIMESGELNRRQVTPDDCVPKEWSFICDCEVLEVDSEYSQLKTELENAVRRGDEFFDQIEGEKLSYDSSLNFKLTQIEQLLEELAKKDEIIVKLKKAVDFYADDSVWSETKYNQCPAMTYGEDIENVKGTDVFIGGLIARQIKSEVEALENES